MVFVTYLQGRCRKYSIYNTNIICLGAGKNYPHPFPNEGLRRGYIYQYLINNINYILKGLLNSVLHILINVVLIFIFMLLSKSTTKMSLYKKMR